MCCSISGPIAVKRDTTEERRPSQSNADHGYDDAVGDGWTVHFIFFWTVYCHIVSLVHEPLCILWKTTCIL